MEFVTAIVRWLDSPNPHGSFTPTSASNWCLMKWKKGGETATVISAQLTSGSLNDFLEEIRMHISERWSTCPRSLSEDADVKNLIQHCVQVIATNKLGYIRTRQIQTSFYEYATSAITLFSSLEWIRSEEGLSTDNTTYREMLTSHEPHRHIAMLAGATDRGFIVQCTQPQTIHQLLKKYGHTCSSVQYVDVNLSANAPCSALVSHRMHLITVNIVDAEEVFHQYNLKSIHSDQHMTLKAKSKTFRHKYRPWNSGGSSDEEGVTVNCVLYYDSDMDRMHDIIKNDGRFADGTICVSQPSSTSRPRTLNDQSTAEVKGMIDAKKEISLEPRRSSVDCPPKTYDREPCACQVCYKSSDLYLPCGHLMCSSCLERMKTLTTPPCCGICREDIATATNMAPNQVYDCKNCIIQKTCVGSCGHLVCYCEDHCEVCQAKVLTLSRIILS